MYLENIEKSIYDMKNIKASEVKRFKICRNPGNKEKELISKTINRKTSIEKATLVNTARWFNAMNQKVKQKSTGWMPWH